jgi:hypothetical protein
MIGLILLGFLTCVRAELQFDVFVGYGLGANEGVVAEGCWFPITFEIYNDGPGFDGVLELETGPGSARHHLAVELPTGTRKRILLPHYASGRWVSLNARLLDAKGRVRASQTQLRPRQTTDRQSPLIGSLSRTLSGAPFLPEPPKANNQMQPAVARLTTELFPDQVIALEGLSVLYLHAAKAAELKAPQVAALLAWLHGGGHLVLGVEQPVDVNSLPWLASLLPCVITGVTTQERHDALQAWLNSDTRAPPPKPAASAATASARPPGSGDYQLPSPARGSGGGPKSVRRVGNRFRLRGRASAGGGGGLARRQGVAGY